jgi:hypothetical protein
VLLGSSQQIVEEGDVELQHLDELHDAAVGDVELAVVATSNPPPAD